MAGSINAASGHQRPILLKTSTASSKNKKENLKELVMTRIKVETEPPLPQLRAWYLATSESSIAQLKTSLCANLLSTALPHSHITLYLDDFPLLDSSPLAILRDGDLVRVKHNQQHRPLDSSLAIPIIAHAPPVARPVQDTVDDSDASSDTSSDTSSESTTTSQSPSSASPSPSSSSPSSPSLPLQALTMTTQPTSERGRDVRHVPPGLGKPSTHSRNLRKRKKKQYDRLYPENSAQFSNPNDIPVLSRPKLSSSEDPATRSRAIPPPIMMASLSNKNKRKGFKKALASQRPNKIIFSEDGLHDASTSIIGSDVAPASPAILGGLRTIAPTVKFASRAPLIFPSQKHAAGQLPANVFVTSVDVEASSAPSGSSTKDHETLETVDDGPPHGTAEPLHDLDRSASDAPSRHTVDFLQVERDWDRLPLITDLRQVVTGSTVAWKDLGINPSTRTPEICLFVGHVVNCDTDKLSVEKLLPHARHELPAGEDDWVMEQVEDYQSSVVKEQGWRILPA